MLLAHLIQDLAILQLQGDLHCEVGDISHHSGRVSEGSLFVAIRGTQSDGHDFVHKAIENGARAVLVEKPLQPIAGVTIIRVENTRVALAKVSNRFYRFPAKS